MEPSPPRDAQRTVAAYLKVVDHHAETDVYPCSIDDLPETRANMCAARPLVCLTLF